MIIGASGGSPVIFIIILAFGVIYLLFVRPQKKRQMQQKQMVDELRVGDEVLTAGGIYGTISEVEEDQVTVEIAPQTEVRVARRAIAGVTRDEEEDDDTEENDEAEAEAAAEPEHPVVAEATQDDEGPGGETSNEENRG